VHIVRPPGTAAPPVRESALSNCRFSKSDGWPQTSFARDPRPSAGKYTHVHYSCQGECFRIFGCDPPLLPILCPLPLPWIVSVTIYIYAISCAVRAHSLLDPLDYQFIPGHEKYFSTTRHNIKNICGSGFQGAISPAILNNLGFACRQLAEFDKAKKYLRQAIAMDKSLPIPHCNLVMVFLNKALLGQPIAPEAFERARRAVELSTPPGSLFRDLGEFYAIAAGKDPSRIPITIDHVKKAFQYGFEAKAFRSNGAFSQLWQEKAFQEALVSFANLGIFLLG
jgi:hypothetical protein